MCIRLYLCDDVAILSVHLSDGTEVSDDAEHFIDLRHHERHQSAQRSHMRGTNSEENKQSDNSVR